MFAGSTRSALLCLAAVLLAGPFSRGAIAQKQPPADSYHIYAGSTHAHTEFTWSHGAQWAPSTCAGILVYGPDKENPDISLWRNGYVVKHCPAIYVIQGLQYPAPSMTLRPDWKQFQGRPSRHFDEARQAGFDFYAATDHSQEAEFSPQGSNNQAWNLTKQQAVAATRSDFVAIAGFEFSENDGPGGTGHINVFNTDSMLNALAPGVDLPYLYRWLARARPNGRGPVVASFNHPGPEQYGDWAGRTDAATDIITMLEVINHNTGIHYEGFIHALDKGWKVSPVSGLDNHGLPAIQTDGSRTFVLATARTKVAILDAMKHRRTYASLDRNLQCRYTVNGRIMGTTLSRPVELRFAIHVSDPDTGNPGDRITKLDIVSDHGRVVQTYEPRTPAYDVTWTPVLHAGDSKYFFVRVWNAGGGDVPKPDGTQPVAWLAPVWTGR